MSLGHVILDPSLGDSSKKPAKGPNEAILLSKIFG